MVRSTDVPAWARLPAKGGYTVHPVPAPASTIDDASKSKKDGGRSQKLLLFIWRNAMSGAFYETINGANQMPKPPNYNWHDYEEDYHKCVGSNNYIINLIIS